jgi:hypothetical protein
MRQTQVLQCPAQLAGISPKASASPNCLSENVGVQTVVISELELGHIEREVFAADLVIAAHHAALNQAPKAFNRIRAQRADDMPTTTNLRGPPAPPLF